MTSRLYLSLCLISLTTGLLSDIVEFGDSIRALFGGIAENWPSKVQVQYLDCTPHVWRFFKIAWPWQQRPSRNGNERFASLRSWARISDTGPGAEHRQRS